MSKKLTGLNPLAYMGVEPSMPPNMFMAEFAPTPNDSKNFNIGDFWVNIASNNLYVLVSLAGGVADWVLIEASPGGPSINEILGSSGTVLPVANEVTITGGNNIVTTGSGSTLTIDLTGTTNHALQIGNSTGSLTSLGVATNGEIPIGSTGADPVLATITAGTGISVTNGAGSITVGATGSVPTTFDGNTGSAIPSANILNIVGDGTTATTVASGSTVTISTSSSVPTTFDGNSGSATPVANVLNIVGSMGITTTASGNTVTITGSGTGGGALSFIGTATATSQTSITFTSGITNSFDNYVLYFDSIEATSTGSAFYLITQLSTDGGATYKTTGYLNAGSSGITSGLIAAAYLTSNPAGTEVASGYQDLLDITSGGANNWPASVSNANTWDGAAADSDTSARGIYETASTVVDAIKILLSNGATFSGTFYLYGYSNTGGGGGGGGTTTFITDSGTATESGGAITIHGTGGISTSGAGATVTITGSGAGITWSTVSGTSQALAAGHGYVINNAGLVTLTLPATAAVGDTFYITGLGAGGWTIVQNSGQLIHFGSAVTTTGVGGSLSSTNRYNTITLVCSVTNTTFNVLASIGNITVV